MADLKAIQTVYRGYKFRSRLEARWAVFFDSLGIRWEYEKEGYDLDGLWYLPDFWLPELNCWAEVKGKIPDMNDDGEWIGEEVEKARRLLEKSENLVFMLCGAMDISQPPTIIGFTYGMDGEIEGAEHYSFARCPICGRVGIVFAGYVRDIGCHCFDDFARAATDLIAKLEDTNDPDWGYWVKHLYRIQCAIESPAIEAAFIKAQQARFEHGEQP